MWWQEIKKVKGIKETHVTLKKFKKLFKRKYVSEQYYEEKEKGFHEPRLAAMTMKELCNKLLILLHYVPYILMRNLKYIGSLVVFPSCSKNRLSMTI